MQTDEGDKVSLSFSATHEAAAVDYSDLGVRARAVAAASSAKVEVSVEGDLNREELHDIQKLAKLLVDTTRKAAKGKEPSLTDIARRFARLDSLASFDYSHLLREEFEYKKVSAGAVEERAHNKSSR